MRKPNGFCFFKRKPIVQKIRYEFRIEIEGFNETSKPE